MNLENIDCIEVEGIDPSDHPDYSDAYISYAEYMGVPLLERELVELTSLHPDFVYDVIFEHAIMMA